MFKHHQDQKKGSNAWLSTIIKIIFLDF